MYINAAHTLGFFAVFAAWAISELAGPVQWSKSRRGERKDQGSIILATVMGLAGVILALWLPLLLPTFNVPTATFFVGIALIVIGEVWRWYSIRTLGDYFTATLMIHENQMVVQHGPYRIVRHPSYTGVLIIVAGLGCMIGNWLSFLTIVIGLLVPLLYRIRVEEGTMRENNKQYDEYMHKTKWRLIPFIF